MEMLVIFKTATDTVIFRGLSQVIKEDKLSQITFNNCLQALSLALRILTESSLG